MTLSDECLVRNHLEFSKYVESQIRCKANRTDEDQVAAELLYAFRLNRAIKVSLSTLKKEPRLYVKPVYIVKADESENLEEMLIRSHISSSIMTRLGSHFKKQEEGK